MGRLASCRLSISAGSLLVWKIGNTAAFLYTPKGAWRSAVSICVGLDHPVLLFCKIRTVQPTGPVV